MDKVNCDANSYQAILSLFRVVLSMLWTNIGYLVAMCEAVIRRYCDAN